MRDAIRLLPLEYNIKYIRPTLTEVHISDIHFGKLDPKVQYDILEEQFLKQIEKIRFDILFINGDIFEHKTMSNSDIPLYACKFVGRCNQICEDKGASLVIIAGTLQHDADQLSLFYHYIKDSKIDVRIVETIEFHNIKGARVLCIPEMYNISEEIYQQYLFNMGDYDMVAMHGTYNGAVYGNNSGYSRLFRYEDFARCRGPIIAGHVHTPGCFNGHVYYCGSPLRMNHGEEEEKGFIILLHNLETQQYYIQMNFIESFRYVTISVDDIITKDPKMIIDYIDELKTRNKIDFIRVNLNQPITLDNEAILKNYYRRNKEVSLQFNYNKDLEKAKDNYKENLDEFKDYEYLLDKSLNEYQVLSMYINQQEGYTFITADELKKIVEEVL
jgi:DNA repair exonuclease SbcCD nuclease subunit